MLKFKNPNKSKLSKKKITKPIAMLLGTFILTLGVSGASTINPQEAAYALDKACPVYAGEDDGSQEYANLGGLTTNQIAHLQLFGESGNPYVEDEPGLTFPEQFRDNMSYVGWVPAIRGDGPLSGDSPVTGTSWSSFSGGSGALEGLPETSVTSPDVIGFLDDRGFCRTEISFKNAETVLPNMFLDFGKFLYDLTDTLYISAMGGSNNTTNVVGLVEDDINADTFDDIYITDDSNNESWSVQVANKIEEGLIGEDGNGGLYNTLFLTFLLPLIFIAAIVIIVNLLRTKAVKALTGFVWVIVVIALGVAVLQSPMAIPKFMDGLVGTIGNTAATAITGAASESDSTLCSIESDTRSQIDIDASSVSCRIWEETIYSAWKRGQFGSDAFPDDVAQEFIQHTYGPQAVNAAYVAAGRDDSENFFTGEGQTYNAVMGIIAISAIGVFVAGNAVLLIAYQISLLLLIFTAPIFFIAGIVPSTMGRGIFLRWGELVVGLFVKKIVVTVLLAVFLAMFFIISSIDFGNLLIQSLLFGIITYIGFSQRGKIIEMFTGNINFGGDKSINMGNSIEKIAEKAPTVAKGAALIAGGAAAYGVGKAAQAGGKFTVNKIGDARAERKISKLVGKGANLDTITNAVQDQAAKRGVRFESKFADEEGNINVKKWVEQKQAQNEQIRQNKQDRQDNKRAKNIIAQAEGQFAPGIPYAPVSKEDLQWARSHQNAQNAVKAQNLADKTADKLNRTISSKSKEKIIDKAKRKASKLGEEGVEIFEQGVTEEARQERINKFNEALNQSAALAAGKKKFKKSRAQRVQSRTLAYGQSGQEYVSGQTEKR